MKQILLISLSVLCLMLVSANLISANFVNGSGVNLDYPSLENGLIAYLNFDETSGTTAVDAVGGRNNITVTDKFFTSGKIDGAWLKDTTSYGNLTYKPITDSITYNYWGNSTGSELVYFGGNGPAIGANCVWSLVKHTTHTFSSNWYGWGGSGILTTANAYPVNEWSMITVVINDTSQALYVNGVLNQTASRTCAGGQLNLDIAILTHNNAVVGSQFAFDNWGIWNRTLNASDVVLLYDNGGGLAYSLVDVSPTVTLIAPTNNTVIPTGNIDLQCDSTDDFSLSNLTFFIYNETSDEINSSFHTISGTTNSTNYTYNFPIGNYTWNCLVYDNNTQSDSGDSYSLQITPVPLNFSEVFLYRKAINITTDGTVIPQDYTMLFNITYATGMQTDFGDIRFSTGELESTRLGYWFKNDSYYNGISAEVYVNIGNLANKTIYLYYGNSTYDSIADIRETFYFGDHFDRDFLGGNWTTEGGPTITVNNSILNMTVFATPIKSLFAPDYNFNHSLSGWEFGTLTLWNPDDPIAAYTADGIANYSSAANQNPRCMFSALPDFAPGRIYYCNYGLGSPGLPNPTTRTTDYTNVWIIKTLIINGSSQSFYEDYTFKTALINDSFETDNTLKQTPMHPYFRIIDDAATKLIDWIYVRPILNPEPVYIFGPAEFLSNETQLIGITIHHPTSTIYTNPLIDLNWSYTGVPDWCAYSLNGGANNTGIYPPQTNVTLNLTVGIYDLDLFCNNTLGNLTIESVAFNVSSNATTINLLSPVDGSHVNAGTQNFTAQLSDAFGLANATFYLYNETDLITTHFKAFNNETSYEYGYVYSIGNDGNYTWYYDGYNGFDNYGVSDNWTLVVDTVLPVISFYNPVNNVTSNEHSMILNASIEDDYLDAINVTVFNFTGDLTYSNYTENITSTTLYWLTQNITLYERDNTIEVCARDSLASSPKIRDFTTTNKDLKNINYEDFEISYDDVTIRRRTYIINNGGNPIHKADYNLQIKDTWIDDGKHLKTDIISDKLLNKNWGIRVDFECINGCDYVEHLNDRGIDRIVDNKRKLMFRYDDAIAEGWDVQFSESNNIASVIISYPDKTFYDAQPSKHTIDPIIGGLNSNCELRNITVDYTLPSGENLLPVNGTLTSTTSINMTVNASDSWMGLANITLYVFNVTGTYVTNFIDVIDGTLEGIWGSVVNFVTDGIYTWYFTIKDLANNTIDTENSTITIDTSGPVITVITPVNNSYNLENYTTDPGPIIVDLNWTVTDLNLDSCWYEFNGTNYTVTCSDNSTTINVSYNTNYDLIFYANDSGGLNTQSQINFSYNYYLYENVTARQFDSTIYETDTITYIFNGTYNTDYNLTGVIFNYDNTNYTANYYTDGTNVHANYTLNIPTISSPVNKTFTWIPIINNISIVTNYSNQTVEDINFNECGPGLTTKYMNVTFKDESTLSYINQSLSRYNIDYYYLGDNSSISNTLLGQNVTVLYEFPFCFDPQHRTVTLKDTTFQYVGNVGTNYQARNAYVNDINLTNSSTEIILYNLLLGSFTDFYFTDLTGSVLADVEVLMIRNIDGSPFTMREVSDASGIANFWVNPNQFYTTTFNKTGCVFESLSIRPTQASYGIQLDCGGTNATTSTTVIPYTVGPAAYIYDGLTFQKAPMTGNIQPGTHNFEFRLDSSVYDIQRARMDLSVNGSIVASVTKNASVDANCTSRYCYINISYDLPDKTILRAAYYVDFGQGYFLLESAAWRSINTTVLHPTFIEGVSDLSNIFNNYIDANGVRTEAGNRKEFSKFIWIFLILTIMIAFFNKYSGYDAANPGAFIWVLTAIVIIFSLIAGFNASSGDQGYFYIQLIQGTGSLAFVINNYMIALISFLFALGFSFSIIRRSTT